jgi:hypothetical protein
MLAQPGIYLPTRRRPVPTGVFRRAGRDDLAENAKRIRISSFGPKEFNLPPVPRR